MNNRIDARVTFSFKGETLAPHTTLDLDRFLQSEGQLPDIYLRLAQENGIGLYSYEYEVLQAYPVEYANAQGLAAEFLSDGEFDAEGFVEAWKQQQVVAQLGEIAREHLQVVDLEAEPALRRALLDAYERGRLAGDSQ